MILTGSEIQKSVDEGTIVLDPFTPAHINPNSYNYRLGDTVRVFKTFKEGKSVFKEMKIPKEGLVLTPHQTYLAKTLERIGSSTYAMSLIGRSSLGRLGLFLQVSANLGHTGSCHCWTLELVAAYPVRIYPGMIIGQVSFWENSGAQKLYEGYYGNFSDVTESQTHIL